MTKLGRVLLVDDDHDNLQAMVMSLEDDLDLVAVSSGAEAIDALKERGPFDCVVLDMRMAKMDGYQTAEALRGLDPDLVFVIHTAYPGDYPEATIRDTIRPAGYVEKCSPYADLARTVKDAVLEYHHLGNPAALIRIGKTCRMVGHSRRMREVYFRIYRVAATDDNVLILGDTGTGKELVARAIHNLSARAAEPFVTFDSSRISAEMAEKELLGHPKGAYTGADRARQGLFEKAGRGTLFIDEIGDLPEKVQLAIRRAIQERSFIPVGDTNAVRIEARLIFATNHDLPVLARSGAFRKDLYFRLRGHVIRLPNLRNRREDIPALIDSFMSRFAVRGSRRVKILAPGARDVLIAHAWPANVRELEWAIKSLIGEIVSDFVVKDHVLSALDCTQDPDPIAIDGNGLRHAEREFRRSLITRALSCHRSQADAARCLGDDSANLRRMMSQLGVESKQHASTRPRSAGGAKCDCLNGYQSRREAERDFLYIKIIQALDRHKNNLSAAARYLEIERPNLHRHLDELGIDLYQSDSGGGCAVGSD